MSAWIDAHNHLHDSRLGHSQPLIAQMKQADVAACIPNAVGEADWSVLSELAIAHPDFVYPAFGIHPWKVAEASEGWAARLRTYLEKHPQASIGECGLDRWISHPTLESQLPVFHDQVRLARQMDRPLTVHCLKAWGPLLESFEHEPPPPRFLMHSFSGSVETGRQLAKLGSYFSFSGHFLHERKRHLIEVFQSLPLDRLLIETDAPDMTPPHGVITHPLPDSRNHPANLAAIGQGLAEALGISADELAEITAENTRRCFGF